MVTLQKYKDLRIKQIENLIDTAGLLSYEITDTIKEGVKQAPQLKDYLEKIATWRNVIQDAKDLDGVDKLYDGTVNLIEKLMKKKHDENIAKINEDAQGGTNYYQDKIDGGKKYDAGEHDGQKDSQKKAEKEQENTRKLNEEKEEDGETKFDRDRKEKYIKDIEGELKLKKVSEEKLNQRLEVSDGREEINKTSGWRQALDRRSDLWTMVQEISREFVCAKCGEADSSYFPYKKGGKKYCSYECQKNDGKIETSDIGKIVQAFQDGMKKNHIQKISYSSSGELVIQFEGEAAKTVEDSQLSAEQKEVKNFFKNNPQTSEIVANKEFEDNSPKHDRKRGGWASKMTGGEIALVGLVIVGVFALIIALIVRATRSRD